MHLLDLVEGAARAGSSLVALSIDEQPEADLLAIELQDDGWAPAPIGRACRAASVSDWAGNRPLAFLDACEAATRDAGGAFSVHRSALGGLAVELQLPLSRIERDPLLDLAPMLAAVAASHPDLDLACQLSLGSRERRWRLSELCAGMPEREQSGLGRARLVAERVRGELRELGLEAEDAGA